MRLWITILVLTMFGSLPAQSSGGHGNPSHAPIGVLLADALEALGVEDTDLGEHTRNDRVRYVGLTKYLNNSRAVVTGTLDDTSLDVSRCIDALDKYGIKASIAVNTRADSIRELWPRLEQAIENHHEIASHSRRHLCNWNSTRDAIVPDTEAFCRSAYSRDEVVGSRNDIVANTSQAYVWTWVYPCGSCARYEFIHERLFRAGYIVARNYPNESQGGALLPNVRTWSQDPYDAGFTGVVQKKGGVAPAGRTDVDALNRTFDEVYESGGIYHFVAHPRWIDYGSGHFFEKHLAHVGGREDVWYVPLGPLYGYQTVVEHTVVSRLKPEQGWERFAIFADLDPAVYRNSITLEFSVPDGKTLLIKYGNESLKERPAGLVTDDWEQEYYRRGKDAVFVSVRPNRILHIRVSDSE